MDAGLLHVLHYSAYVHVLTIAEGVDVDLGGMFEEAVDQHWMQG